MNAGLNGVVVHLMSSTDAAAVSGLREALAGSGGSAAEARSGGGRHRHTGRPRQSRQRQRTEVCRG